MEENDLPLVRGHADGRGLSLLVHAAFLGLAEGGASRQVVAAAIAALVRSRTGEGNAEDGSAELAQRVLDIKQELKTREAVGLLAGRVFSHTKPAREFLTGVNQQLGSEYALQIQRRNVAAHPGEKAAGRKRRSNSRVAVNEEQDNEKEKDIEGLGGEDNPDEPEAIEGNEHRTYLTEQCTTDEDIGLGVKVENECEETIHRDGRKSSQTVEHFFIGDNINDGNMALGGCGNDFIKCEATHVELFESNAAHDIIFRDKNFPVEEVAMMAGLSSSAALAATASGVLRMESRPMGKEGEVSQGRNGKRAHRGKRRKATKGGSRPNSLHSNVDGGADRQPAGCPNESLELEVLDVKKPRQTSCWADMSDNDIIESDATHALLAGSISDEKSADKKLEAAKSRLRIRFLQVLQAAAASEGIGSILSSESDSWLISSVMVLKGLNVLDWTWDQIEFLYQGMVPMITSHIVQRNPQLSTQEVQRLVDKWLTWLEEHHDVGDEEKERHHLLLVRDISSCAGSATGDPPNATDGPSSDGIAVGTSEPRWGEGAESAQGCSGDEMWSVGSRSWSSWSGWSGWCGPLSGHPSAGGPSQG